MEHANETIDFSPEESAILPLPDIKNYTKERLTTWLQDNGIAPYRADQIFKWVYQHQVNNFADMTNISKKIRDLLSRSFALRRLNVKKTQASADGTRKYLFALEDNACIESVLIPEEGHNTLCISTQVGCAQGCRFCLTARSGFTRNLTAAEITGQILEVRHALESSRKLTNIVLMGMGEPLANLKSVLAAVSIITDSDCGMKFSTRRVTLSTSGLVPGIKALGQASRINLAVSLNATDDRTRDFLMPINKKYPIKELLAACAAYPLSHRQKITVEYILIRGVNDTEADAGRLIRLLKPVKAKINLIPFNEHRQSDFKRPDEAVVDRFKQILHDHQYTVMTRLSKGADISAACGQLSADVSQYDQSPE